MERDDLLHVLRDAMLTSTEISQYLLSELFLQFCVTRKVSEEQSIAARREADARPRDGKRTQRSVSIVPPSVETTSVTQSETSRRSDVKVLLFDGFVQILCVLCNFKQPNPLVPFGKRLHTFLRRSLLRPLSSKIDQLAPLLNATKNAVKEDNPGEGN
ncbi:hypothetical protein ADEAN_001039500 [Angomonas deanei]|uniref:Uncharacterized protein n=1 Tax=Angomonas deanei TaxID=59799 RepID=A0A7G2CUU9_9TRYP|nr:hypothetical protein ADEAN_001039500 [Angomonas deanei]